MDSLLIIRLPRRFFFLYLQFSALVIGANLRGETAKDTLALLKGHRGALIVQNVTTVRGHRGQDQPSVWEVATRMSEGERVFVISDKQIIADTVYSSGGGVVVDLRRLKIDSGDVFRVANRAAVMAKVGFDSIDYELRAAPLGNAPLWIVHLRNFAGQDVGRLEVSGESADVLRSKWFDPRIAMREPIGPEDGTKRTALRSYDVATPDQGPVLLSRGRESTFADEPGWRLKRGFRAAGMGFNRIFSGQSAVSSVRSRHKHPATSRQRPR